MLTANVDCKIPGTLGGQNADRKKHFLHHFWYRGILYTFLMSLIQHASSDIWLYIYISVHLIQMCQPTHRTEERRIHTGNKVYTIQHVRLALLDLASSTPVHIQHVACFDVTQVKRAEHGGPLAQFQMLWI